MTFKALLALTALAWAGAAQAHVGIVEGQARPGATQTVTFRVSHGCAGQATTGLTVSLPAGVAAEPAAKPGWTIRATPTALTWAGRSPERQPDTFAVTLRLPAAAGPLYFPAVQTCGAQTIGWDEIPTAGAADSLSHPAPVLLLTDAPQAAGTAPEHHH